MTSSPALSVLLSLTAADALGAATEFKRPSEIRQLFPQGLQIYQPGSPFGFAPGEATDDSQMTVATLLGYASGREGVLPALLDWVNSGPPDVGGLTRSALGEARPSGGYTAWLASGRNSAGNGGLMRIAAPFIAGFRGESLLDEAVRVTALTHADPRCVLASVFFVAFLEALERAERYDTAAQEAVERMKGFDAVPVMLGLKDDAVEDVTDAYRALIPTASQQVERAIQHGLAGHINSQSGYVLDTLQAALAHGRGESWLGCIEPAVLGGDDSDTVACVTGAIVGARGLSVPEHLLPDLRLGNTWRGWQRDWRCTEHFPALIEAAERGSRGRV